MDTKTKDLIKIAKEKANQAAQEWLKKNELHIERRVQELLNDHVQEVVSKLLWLPGLQFLPSLDDLHW